MLIKMCLPKCDIYRKLKQTQNLDALIFPKKKFNLGYEILRRNIVSTG